MIGLGMNPKFSRKVTKGLKTKDEFEDERRTTGGTHIC
jgi:hypothetical protein